MMKGLTDGAASSIAGGEAKKDRSDLAVLTPAVRGAALTQSLRRHIQPGALVANLALLTLGIVFAIPLVWVVLAAFDAQATNGLQWPHWGLDNFAEAFSKGLIVQPFLNSLYLAALSTIVTTLFGLTAAYAVSRRNIPFKRPFLYIILFSTGLPINMLLVPVYSMFVSFSFIDSLTWTSVFLAAISIPFAIWILKNFIDSIPLELEEAAQVDGASTFQILRHIALPLAIPGISVSAMLTFLNSWSIFLVPYILLETPSKLPMAISIYQFEGAYGAILYGQIAAASLIFSLPVVVLYLVLSRHLAGAFNFGGGVRG